MTSSGAGHTSKDSELADILGQDDLTVTQESTVYQSVLRWINHMPEERQGAISTLLPKVRLGLMDKSYITDNVLNNDVVKTNPESHLLVSDTLKVMSQPSLLCSESGINNTLFCRRLPNAVLLMVGLFSNTTEAFDYRTNSWITVHTHPRRISASCTTLNNKIYICGGQSNRILKTAEYYNPDTNQWTLITPMGTPRCDLGVVAYMGHIFAVGGRDGPIDLRVC
uniref:BACK domain-containing protein n=1 Tax=Gouania willdenowi TaxID=441366 RepID=A0A8C5GJ45_GOUWI